MFGDYLTPVAIASNTQSVDTSSWRLLTTFTYIGRGGVKIKVRLIDPPYSGLLHIFLNLTWWAIFSSSPSSNFALDISSSWSISLKSIVFLLLKAIPHFQPAYSDDQPHVHQNHVVPPARASVLPKVFLPVNRSFSSDLTTWICFTPGNFWNNINFQVQSSNLW